MTIGMYMEGNKSKRRIRMLINSALASNMRQDHIESAEKRGADLGWENMIHKRISTTLESIGNESEILEMLDGMDEWNFTGFKYPKL